MRVKRLALDATAGDEIVIGEDPRVIFAVGTPRELAMHEAFAVCIRRIHCAEDHHDAQIDVIEREGDLRVKLPLRALRVPLHNFVWTPLGRLKVVGAAEARADRADGSVALRGVTVVLVPLDLDLAAAGRAVARLPPYRAAAAGITRTERPHSARVPVTKQTLVK